MGKLQWYKRFPENALEGMKLLTLEERGAYNTVLDLIYLREGKLDDDLRFVAGWLGVDVRVWKRIRARLMELGKLYSKEGLLLNGRADREVATALAKLVATQNQNVIKGHKSGAVRRKNKDLAEPDASRERTDLDLDIESKKEDDDEGAGVKSPLVSAESNSLADEVATIVGHDLNFVPPAWCGASYVAQKWLSSGWRREIILASVREQMARRNGDPPDRIIYFEKGIAGAHARHEAPLPAGTPGRRPHAKTGNGNIIQAADRLIERIRAFDKQIPDAAGGSGLPRPPPIRLLPTGGRE